MNRVRSIRINVLVLIRLFILVASPLLFYAAYELWPQLASKEVVWSIAGVFAVIWAGVLWIFSKLGEVSKVEGLAGRERERLDEATGQVSRRLWWIAVMVALAAAVLTFLAALHTAVSPVTLVIGAGILCGIGASYLFLVPFWYGELDRFISRVRAREERRKVLERAMKDLPGSVS